MALPLAGVIVAWCLNDMNKPKSIFLTGVTGFLGRYLARELLNRGYLLYVLARTSKEQLFNDRVICSLKFAFDEDWNEKVIANLRIIEGDITIPKLGIVSSKILSELLTEVETIYHCAALPEMRVPLEAIRKINVYGTRNVLDLAIKMKQEGKLKKINHISTAYVVGKKSIEFSEDLLNVAQDFNNTYEQSKFEAENLVNSYKKRGLNISTFRPTMIVGDSKKGKIDRFRLFYQALHYFSRNIFNKYPIDLNCYQNFINVDVAASIVSILGEEVDNVYHVMSPNDIKLSSFFETVSEYFSFKIPEFIPLDKFNFGDWTPSQKILAEPQIPYFNYKARFLSNKTQAILRKYNFDFVDMDKENLQRLFSYCVAKAYI